MAVYFIRAGDDGPVKIGWARCVETRLRELQCGSWLPLTVLRDMPGGVRTEKQAHRAFRDRRLRGEWFAYSDAMLQWNPVPEPSYAPPHAHEGFIRGLEAGVGGTSALARALGVTRQTVHAWRRIGVNRHYRFMVKAVASKYGVPTPDGFAVLGSA